MTSQQRPFRQIAVDQLADWIVRQGDDRWWTIDGDPTLTGQLDLPCPGDELAAVLRRNGPTVIVWDPERASAARGEQITADELDRFALPWPDETVPVTKNTGERALLLSWPGSSPEEWLLIEDRATARLNRAEA